MYKEQSVESILKLTPKEALESIIQDEISVTGITYGVDSFRFKINNVDYNFKLLEYGEISVRIDIKAPYHPSRFFKSHNSNSDILRYIKKHHKINNNLSKIKDLILDDLKKEYKNISVEAILTNLHPYDNLGVFSINSIDYSNEQTHLTFQQDPLVKIDRIFFTIKKDKVIKDKISIPPNTDIFQNTHKLAKVIEDKQRVIEFVEKLKELLHWYMFNYEREEKLSKILSKNKQYVL